MERDNCRRGDEPVEQHGYPRCRALRVAAAIATISLPPRQRNASIGFTTPTRSTASATTLCLFASASPTTPVPGPTQSAAGPPSTAAVTAAAGVLLPIPISPKMKRSASTDSTAAMPMRALYQIHHRSLRRRFECWRWVHPPRHCGTKGGPDLTHHSIDGRYTLVHGCDHCPSHICREGTHTIVHDSMVCAKYGDMGSFNPWRRCALPTGQPRRYVVKSTNAPGGRSVSAACRYRRCGHNVRLREVFQHAVRMETLIDPPGSRREQHPRRRNRVRSAIELKRWFTEPSRSWNRLAVSFTGTMPEPTSFVTIKEAPCRERSNRMVSSVRRRMLSSEVLS